jgi:hypothetical protein
MNGALKEIFSGAKETQNEKEREKERKRFSSMPSLGCILEKMHVLKHACISMRRRRRRDCRSERQKL